MFNRCLLVILTIIFASSFANGSYANPLSIFTCSTRDAGSVVVERNENGHYRLVRVPFNTDNTIGELPLDLLTAAICKAQGRSLFLFARKERDFITWRGQDNAIEELSLFWQAKGYCVQLVGSAVFIYRDEDTLLQGLRLYSAHCESNMTQNDLLCADLPLLPSSQSTMRLTVIDLCKVEANQAICCLQRSSKKSQVMSLFRGAH